MLHGKTKSGQNDKKIILGGIKYPVYISIPSGYNRKTGKRRVRICIN